MKKDALYYGILIAFVSFFLMIVFFIYDAWKSSHRPAPIPRVGESESSSNSLHRRDFSEYEFIKDKDGAQMVLIREGPFQMGSLPVKGDSDEFPQHAVYLPPFYIDLKEVTQGAYARFSKATGYPMPVVPVFPDDISLITKPELPAVGVSWDAAKSYCQWNGKRLPTEAEWEKAAGGEESILWPWGNEIEDRVANLQGQEDGFKYLAPPGQFELGRSPYGLYDAAGNAAEWVSDWYDADYYKNAPFKNPKGPETGKFRVYRGGSWNESVVNARVSKRFMAAPHQTSAVIGFRCAMDATPAPQSKNK